MMDEIFSEDTVGVNSNNQRQTENYKQPLQRSTSVSNNIAEGKATNQHDNCHDLKCRIAP